MSHVPDHALHARFLRGLALCPASNAVRTGDQTLRYDAAYELALHWAGGLAAAADGPLTVGILADKGVGAYIGVLGALFAGATVVPLNPELPPARLAMMLHTAGANAVLADQHGAAVLARSGVDLPVVGTDTDPSAGRRKALDAPRWGRPSDVAYILFTSGSTGRPKGVPITHANLHYHFGLMDRRFDFHAGDVFSQVLELNFDCAIFELFSAWAAGGTVCHVPAFAYLDMASFLRDRGVTVWFSTPSAIRLIRRTGSLGPGALPTLRWSCFAGEALTCSDAADWAAAADRSVIENLYGPTELTLTITAHRWSPDTSPRLAVNGVVPIGPVYPGHRYMLLGPDGSAVTDEGELCVTGPQMTPGYLTPSDNEGRFIVRETAKWYRTGDRVRLLPDGQLAYLGRNDSQVQLGGMRVELAEVDHAVRACRGVTDAVTVTRPTTEDDLELVTFYTGVPSSPVDLARQLRENLPTAMIPRLFRLVDEFPLNANRKIDRFQLADSAAARE